MRDGLHEAQTSRYAQAFRFSVLLGVLANLLGSLPGTFNPNAVLQLTGSPPSPDPKWAAFCSWLLILLSVSYVPAALFPFRYLVFAVLAVTARLGGVVFFFLLYPGQFPWWFGSTDLAFMLIEGSLLYLAYRDRRAIVAAA